MHKELRTAVQNDKTTDTEKKALRPTPFWSASVLELVELVFRPPNGGPPLLPEHGDAVFL